jgi:hypothetical protein
MEKNHWSFIAGNKLSVAEFMVAQAYFTFTDPRFGLGLDKDIFS